MPLDMWPRRRRRWISEANHFQAARFGIEVSLVRTSVGMESCDELLASFERALGAIEQLRLHSESGH